MTSNDNDDSLKFELIVFKSEKSKRFKKGILWKNHKELISDGKIIYNNKDKRLIENLLYNPIPSEFRSKYWLIISGAKQEILNNPGYYDKLKKLAKIAPNFPHGKSIMLDIHRTFPSMDFFKKEENLEKLSNILLAFSLRNSISIGYCQGFNFIVGQILLINQNEEETFWIFTKIVEDFLPFDFYLKFSGVRIDTSIVFSMLVKKLNYIDKNEGLKLCLNNLINRCFISLYSEIVGIDVSRNILDIFFIYGDRILFRTFTYIAYLLCDKKYEKYDIEQIHDELIQKLEKIDDSDLLNYFLLTEHKINESYIKENRKRKKIKIYEQNVNFKESIAGNEKLKCDLRTPYCVYNNEINNVEKYNEFKIFRIKKNTKCYPNYFTKKLDDKIIYDDEFEKNNISNSDLNENDEEITLDDFDNILVERHNHVCT